MEIALKNKNIEIVFPVHLNPNIQKNAKLLLKANNIKLINPLDYPDLIWIMDKSYFILTDSGGIQEEAPSLGKPVLVLREVTERTEGVVAGTAILVGSSKDKIISEAFKLLNDNKYYNEISLASNPYGDGKTSEKIKLILSQYSS
jgi:UDP-N-acetylglucosamine 2-epimerase (non-hydrolysing)